MTDALSVTKDQPRVRKENSRRFRRCRFLLGPAPRAGENVTTTTSSARSIGPAPRARGERIDLDVNPRHARTSPACAGRTDTMPAAAVTCRDQPRVRGENT